ICVCSPCPFSTVSFPTLFLFFFTDPAPTEIYTLSLHDALPICSARKKRGLMEAACAVWWKLVAWSLTRARYLFATNTALVPARSSLGWPIGPSLEPLIRRRWKQTGSKEFVSI